MRACKPLVLALLLLGMAGVEASSSRTVRVGITLLDRCDVRTSAGAAPSVACSAGTPYLVAPAAAPDAAPVPTTATSDGDPARMPVPDGGPVDPARVTTIVF
ncbi:hypothetical protein B1992_08735 [Pseudoxanthomonas broegbernensis]|uniref:Secreted protein n=1 Tax=Pseudoxanthomonas broegbernensis TaxID=83619 RepID=A0A7V8K795_9GAMM|nr:hypothetical protein [Pseudoxanthomonas broegbernensis]KAF1686298.1 hypothetical protein B1992_08735 [Pseudoxanthomonas broegbernensis]MBB6063984.1 hypothetical protein [Pseudoxanthomonas broegbernensis]